MHTETQTNGKERTLNVIETYGLEKMYSGKRAVNHFDMHVSKGDIYGFVGLNGAGKSTVMKMLAGLAQPTAGEIRLFGDTAGSEAVRRMGVLVEAPGLYGNMTAYDNMMLKALALGLVEPKRKVEELLGFVGLGNVGKKKTKQFSMGMKQRLGLGLALLGDPDLLLLDEPLNGLDPEGAREIRELIMRLNAERGITVVISSHILEQLGRMATRYGVIRNGQMVRELTATEVEQECSDCLQVATADPARSLAVLQERFPRARFQVMPDNSIRIYGLADTAAIGGALSDAGIVVEGLYAHRRDLEEFFVGLMGAEYHG